METLQRTANRGSISTATYEIGNSINFESGNTESLTKSQTASNRKTWTLSWWFKRTKIDTDLQYLFHANVSSGNEFYLVINGTSDFRIDDYASGAQIRFHSGGSGESFRDPAAWYHVVIACDTTQSTEANRFKVYINGVDVTAISGYFSTAQYPSEDYETHINDSSSTLSIGKSISASTNFCGYICEFNFIDGLMKEASDFGETNSNGIWIPKEYTGSYGNEGYFLNFADGGDLGDDESGNGKDFTENNITAADQATDTCTNNFCTLNSLVNFKYGTNSSGMTDGATVFGDDTGGGIGGAFGTFGVTAGKWYWEVKLTQQVAHYIGVSAVDDGDNVLVTSDPQDVNSTFNFNISAARIEYHENGSKVNGSTDAFSDFHTVGDIIGIALNMDDNQISIYGNGTLQVGVANTSIFDAANKMVVPFHGTINDECQYNFGGYSVWTPSSVQNDENGYGTFEYAPPSGYYALCTQNLALYGG